MLQDNFGYRGRFSVEAPEASRWSVGTSTGASGPATYSDKITYTGPTPDSVAVGVNPTGGFAEYKDTARVDATLPRYSAVARASMANTVAADVSLGTKILPEVQRSTKIRPTVPLTFPVFSAGGKILPEPQGQMVINPRAPPPAPKAKAGEAEGSRRCVCSSRAAAQLTSHGQSICSWASDIHVWLVCTAAFALAVGSGL